MFANKNNFFLVNDYEFFIKKSQKQRRTERNANFVPSSVKESLLLSVLP